MYLSPQDLLSVTTLTLSRVSKVKRWYDNTRQDKKDALNVEARKLKLRTPTRNAKHADLNGQEQLEGKWLKKKKLSQ
jgi:hypothetical protein